MQVLIFIWTCLLPAHFIDVRTRVVKVFARIWLGSFKMAGNFSVGSYVHWAYRMACEYNALGTMLALCFHCNLISPTA